MKKIKIKYHNDNLIPIQAISIGDWVDLRAAETVRLTQGEFKLISLGISIELPKEYEAHIVPRSSTYKNWGILQANHMGVIDNSYSGDNDVWRFPAIATKDTTIFENERICQFRIVKKQPKLRFVKVNHLKNRDRGGFGSTGSK